MIETRRYTLGNGLRVIHNYEPSTVMVAVDVLYDTGSRDESRRLTGIAHLFEHLMFGGSVHVPHFDRELEDAGGDNNAWTSNDFTNFYDILPAQNVETAFHLESDRMLGLAFSEKALEVQRRVVVEEFKQQCLNQPYGDLMHALRGALYSPENPYSWPVIGLTPEHIERVTNDDIRQWFYRHYAPDNAVLAISGNLGYDEGRRLAERWFGDIPARHPAPRIMPPPGFPDADRHITITGPVPHPMIVIAIPMGPYGTKDYRVADCITDILSSGRSARLFQRLVAGGDGTIIEADASIAGSEGPGFVMLNARTESADEHILEQTESRLLDELAKLGGADPVDRHELERAFNRFESSLSLSNYSILSKAQNLALAEMHGEDINGAVALQRAIAIDDIGRVARRLALTPKVFVRYLPKG